MPSLMIHVNALQAATLEARLRNIVEALTYDVYDYTCLGLFESHKLMFSFQVCVFNTHAAAASRTHNNVRPAGFVP